MPRKTNQDPRPKCRADVSVRQVKGEIIVLDRKSNRVHQLNATAGLIWKRCDGEHSLGRISSEIAETFGIDGDLARRDAERTVEEFVRLGLLEANSSLC